MKKFTIADFENFSGIKAHSIRTWEQRYALLKPSRTVTNFRYYSLDELKLLLDISLLNQCGYRISQLAVMGDNEMGRKINGLVGFEERKRREINRLIVTMFLKDTEDFEQVIDNCILIWGIDVTLREIIIPFLEKTELLSYQKTTNEVHLVVTTIRRKIILGIEKQGCLLNPKRKALFFLSEGEHYDLMLLYMSYQVKALGMSAIYLGTNVPIDNLKAIIVEKEPQLIFTYLTPKQNNVSEIAGFLHKELPGSKFFIAASKSKFLEREFSPNVFLVDYRRVSEHIHEAFKKEPSSANEVMA